MQVLHGMLSLAEARDPRFFYFTGLPNEEVRRLRLCPVPPHPDRLQMYSQGEVHLYADGLVVDGMFGNDPIGLRTAYNAVRCKILCVVVDNGLPTDICLDLGSLIGEYAELVALAETPKAAHQKLLALAAERERSASVEEFLPDSAWSPLREPLLGTLVTC
ncbi:MAG: hypothetical protein WD972_01110 [Candidatus Andersenbacteria bacterium]